MPEIFLCSRRAAVAIIDGRMTRVRLDICDRMISEGPYAFFEEACDLLGVQFDELAREVLRCDDLEALGTADGRMLVPFAGILKRLPRLTDEEIKARVKALKASRPSHGFVHYSKAAQACGEKPSYVSALCRSNLIAHMTANKKRDAKHKIYLVRISDLRGFQRRRDEGLISDAAIYQAGRRAAPALVKHVLPP